MFDLTRRITYENVPKWIKELKENAQESMVCILIGTWVGKQETRVTGSKKER